MIISAHWKVYNKHGKEIDKIENDLSDITQVEVKRTESPTSETNFDAAFVVVGDIEPTDLIDACEYMNEVGAYPI